MFDRVCFSFSFSVSVLGCRVCKEAIRWSAMANRSEDAPSFRSRKWTKRCVTSKLMMDFECHGFVSRTSRSISWILASLNFRNQNLFLKIHCIIPISVIATQRKKDSEQWTAPPSPNSRPFCLLALMMDVLQVGWGYGFDCWAFDWLLFCPPWIFIPSLQSVAYCCGWHPNACVLPIFQNHV